MSPDRRDRLASMIDALRERPASAHALESVLRLSTRAVETDLAELQTLGIVEHNGLRSHGSAYRVRDDAPELPEAIEEAPHTRHVPVLPEGVGGLERGPGERREGCASYAECLHAFVLRSGGARLARCPKACAGYAEVPRAHRVAEASIQRDEVAA